MNRRNILLTPLLGLVPNVARAKPELPWLVVHAHDGDIVVPRSDLLPRRPQPGQTGVQITRTHHADGDDLQLTFRGPQADEVKDRFWSQRGSPWTWVVEHDGRRYRIGSFFESTDRSYGMSHTTLVCKEIA